MSNYIENLKSDVESANEIIQSLLPLRASLEQSTLRSIWKLIVNRCSWDSKSLRAVRISNESCRIKSNAVSWRNVCSCVKLCGLGKCLSECELSVGNSYQWINFKFQSIFVCLYQLHSFLYSQFVFPAFLTYSIITFLGFLATLSNNWSKSKSIKKK